MQMPNIANSLRYETHETIKVAQMKSQHVKNITGLEIKYVPTLILYPQGIENIAQVSSFFYLQRKLNFNIP